jgi:hypothetical protein
LDFAKEVAFRSQQHPPDPSREGLKIWIGGNDGFHTSFLEMIRHTSRENIQSAKRIMHSEGQASNRLGSLSGAGDCKGRAAPGAQRQTDMANDARKHERRGKISASFRRSQQRHPQKQKEGCNFVSGVSENVSNRR